MNNTLTLSELLTLDEIINDLLKEDQDNTEYKTILNKINSKISEYIPF